MRAFLVPVSLLVTVVLAAACSPSEVEIVPANGPAAAPSASTSPRAATPTRSPTATPTPTPVPDPLADVACAWPQTVTVVDGDTVEAVMEDGTTEQVRLIGVDSPEGGQLLAAEASAYLASLLTGRICLETDTTDRDRLGRLLRYAWREDGLLLNEAMVAAGLAQVVTFPPDVRYLESRYMPAEAEARAAGRGLWAALPTPVPTNGVSGGGGGSGPTPSAPQPAGDCDPSYPDVCIPPVAVSGDLNCGDIEFRRFRVLPPDPHRFDGNGDGVGCES